MTTGTAQSKRKTKEIISFLLSRKFLFYSESSSSLRWSPADVLYIEVWKASAAPERWSTKLTDQRQLCAALPCVALQHPVRILPRKTVLILKKKPTLQHESPKSAEKMQDWEAWVCGQHIAMTIWYDSERSAVIAEIFVRVKISYSSVRELSYAISFRTERTVAHTLLYVHGFRMLLNFVRSAESTKSTKLNRVRKFLRLQYLDMMFTRRRSPIVSVSSSKVSTFLSSSYRLQKFTDRLRVNRRPIWKDFFPEKYDFVPIVFTLSSCKRGLRKNCLSEQLCVRAENFLESCLLAKEAWSPKCGIVKALFFPNHTSTLTPTLLKYRYHNPIRKRKRFRKSLLKSFWALNCARRNYFYLEHRISHGCVKAAQSADRQLVKISGSSKALVSPNYNPYPNPNLTKIPLPKP